MKRIMKNIKEIMKKVYKKKIIKKYKSICKNTNNITLFQKIESLQQLGFKAGARSHRLNSIQLEYR